MPVMRSLTRPRPERSCSRRSSRSLTAAAPTRIANRISGSTSPRRLRSLPTKAPNRFRGMNISTIAIGVTSGCPARFATCCAAAPPYSSQQLVPGLGRHRGAGLDHVHHDEAERHGDRHVQEEEHESPHRERPERREMVELGDAHGERREDERDDHEEQHPQEDLPDRVEHQRRELARALEEIRREVADEQRDAAGQGADRRGRSGSGWQAGRSSSAVMSSSPGTGRRPQW